jgi:hypothetical protein
LFGAVGTAAEPAVDWARAGAVNRQKVSKIQMVRRKFIATSFIKVHSIIL